jgi:quercetin dioxygenase-like cupin family protein
MQGEPPHDTVSVMGTSDNIVRIGALELRFLLDETQAAGDTVIFEFLIPPGARVPEPHFHRAVDEVLYGVAGTITSTVDGVQHQLQAGDSLTILRGQVHHHTNLGDVPARSLVVLNGGTIGRRYFEEIATAVNGPGRPDPAVVHDIMQRHGLIPA